MENTIDLKRRKDTDLKAAYSHSSTILIIDPFYLEKVRVVFFSSNLLSRGVDFQPKKESKCNFPCFKEKTHELPDKSSYFPIKSS